MAMLASERIVDSGKVFRALHKILSDVVSGAMTVCNSPIILASTKSSKIFAETPIGEA